MPLPRLTGRPLGRAAALLLVVGALSGCGEKNPLIGKWKKDMDPSASMADKMAANFTVGDEIEFKPHSLVAAGGAPVPIRYDHRDGYWFISPDDQAPSAKNEGALAFKVIDADRIEIDIGLSKPVPYTRVK